MFKGFFAALFDAILGVFGLRRASPKIEEIAASNATAQAELAQERAANELHTTAAAARSDADSRVVRIITESPDSVNAELKRRFPDDFR
jgi:hypothetical protein